MPDQRDTDVERKDPEDLNVDGYHDALISNPDLREAYNKAREQGLTVEEAHERARREVFGDEYYEQVHADEPDGVIDKKGPENTDIKEDESGVVNQATFTDFDDES